MMWFNRGFGEYNTAWEYMLDILIKKPKETNIAIPYDITLKMPNYTLLK